MEIIQLVGYQNSGKTTFAKSLITYLTNKGIRVASLKHHGHGGIPEGIKDKDSEQHRQAGAMIAGVKGEGIFQMSQQEDWDVEKMIAIYKHFNPDVLILEGFKKHAFKKIVLIKKQEDIRLLKQLENIQAVISSFRIDNSLHPYPIFLATNIEEVNEWILHAMIQKTEGHKRVT